MKLKNKKTMRTIFFLIIVFVVIVFVSTSLSNLAVKKNIEYVLNSEHYSYLSLEAKNYIKEVYAESGEIILTEKNKEENKPYLNPEYIEYLDEDVVSSTGYLPSVLTYDYNYNYNLNGLDIEDLPSKYDSRNVDGNNYVTPTKKQYNELCWNYAYTAVIESKLLRAGFETNALELDLAERMIDYATSVPVSAIDVEKNPYYGDYTLNSLSGQGNDYRYSSVLVNGLFPIYESDWQYEKEYTGKVRPEDIYDFNKINYQVNEIIYIQDDNLNVGFDENTNKILKQNIMENGAVGLSLRVGAGRNYVSYKVSEEERLNADKERNTLYYKAANAMYLSNDHMVAIIGWDDTYVHNVCVASNGELTDSVYTDGVYSCNTGTLKTINGAWIIKDSSNVGYHYVAYETVKSTYSLVTDISYRDWDNVYSSTNSDSYTKNNITYTFTKQNNIEKVNSIKFYANNAIEELKVYINAFDGAGEQLYATFNTEVGGMYTIPITDEVLLSSDKFSVSLSTKTSITDFSVFTNNLNDDLIVEIDDAKVVNSFSYQSLLDDYENVIVISGVSRNVNDSISYVIKDSQGADVTNLFYIFRNYSVGNYINTIIKFNNNVPLGEYMAYAYINDSLVATFKININYYMENLSGDGSKENPFIITNPVQLDMIRLNQYNFYKLGSDIDLSYDTQNENGLFYNGGLGWEPISYSSCSSNGNRYAYCNNGFSGGFDGNNHKIIGLYINRPEENIVGLFRNTYNNNYSGLNFRNIILKDVNITGNNYVGGLIGYAYGTTHERTLIFENISVTGKINGNNYVGGIIGYFNGGTGLDNYLVDDTQCTKRHCLNNLFNSSKIEGNNYVGGIVGLLASYGNYSDNVKWRSTIDAYYWQNNGTIISDNNASGLIGYVLNKNGNIITLNDSINTGIVKSASSAAIATDVECSNSNDSYPNCSILFNNIYYINETGYNTNQLISANNVMKYDIGELTDDSIYSSFTKFDKHYKKETINSIERIPFISNAYIEYTEVNDINIEVGETVYLTDYIYPKAELAQKEILDSTIASIDSNNKIVGHKAGNTTIHITSYYDGYEKDVNIVVTNPVRTINFDSNGGSSVTDIIGIVGEHVDAPAAPTKTGYVFKGWYLDNGLFENEFVFNIIPEDNITLYAKWEAEKYTISFDANDGTFADNTTTIVIENWKDSKLDTLEKPTRLGYVFKGYYTEKIGGTSLENYIVESGIDKAELVFYAQWEVEKYTLSFNANGGIGTMNNQEFVYDESQKITKNAYVKSGYKFKGWNTKADGTGTSYTDEETIKLTKNLILYAIWEETYSYIINKYSYDDSKKYIDKIDINTTVDDFKKNIDINIGYSIDVTYKTISGKKLLYTGSKTKIYKNNNLIIEYTNIIRGDVSGDGEINYLDYVNVYNHIQKIKHPESDKKELVNEYLIAADMSGEGKINYLDYVQIYNKIKELKGGN